MNWIEQAKDIPLGQKRRIQCCGRNRDAVISSELRGYSFHCFKCGGTAFHRIDTRTLQELKISKLNEAPDPTVLPYDLVQDIPLQHVVWLYKAGITRDECIQAGIGWSDSMQRIVIPIYSDDGELLYFQCRAVHKGQLPKYKNPQVCKKNIIFKQGPDPPPPLPSAESYCRNHIKHACCWGLRPQNPYPCRVDPTPFLNFWVRP